MVGSASSQSPCSLEKPSSSQSSVRATPSQSSSMVSPHTSMAVGCTTGFSSSQSPTGPSPAGQPSPSSSLVPNSPENTTTTALSTWGSVWPSSTLTCTSYTPGSAAVNSMEPLAASSCSL